MKLNDFQGSIGDSNASLSSKDEAELTFGQTKGKNFVPPPLNNASGLSLHENSQHNVIYPNPTPRIAKD